MTKYTALSFIFFFSFALGTTGALADSEGPPRWVLDPSATPEHAAVGQADLSSTSIEKAKAKAEAKAKASLARKIGKTITTVVMTVSETKGLDGEVIRRLTERVEKSVTKATLYGVVVKDTWRSPEEEIYVLVSIDDPESVKKSVKESLGKGYKEELGELGAREEKKLLQAVDGAMEDYGTPGTFNIGVRG